MSSCTTWISWAASATRRKWKPHHGRSRAHILRAGGSQVSVRECSLTYAQTKFALNMISIVGLGLIKSSILVMYKNIFATPKFRRAVYIVLAYVVGWTISFTFSHLFTCYPITVFIEPYYGNSCVETVPMFFALLVRLLKHCGYQHNRLIEHVRAEHTLTTSSTRMSSPTLSSWCFQYPWS